MTGTALLPEEIDASGYNCDNNRLDKIVNDEIEATLEDISAYFEVTGHQMRDVDGYKLKHDRSTRPRSNIACAWRENRFKLKSYYYVDLSQRWPRVKGPGMHEPRSLLVLMLEDQNVVKNNEHRKNKKNPMVRVVVGQAPQLAFGTIFARLKFKQAFAKAMFPDWEKAAVKKDRDKLVPTIGLLDANRLGRKIAKKAKGSVVGKKATDIAIVRGFISKAAWYIHKIGNLILRSDHGEAFRAKLVRK